MGQEDAWVCTLIGIISVIEGHRARDWAGHGARGPPVGDRHERAAGARIGRLLLAAARISGLACCGPGVRAISAAAEWHGRVPGHPGRPGQGAARGGLPGSSMVEGTGSSYPSANPCLVLQRILLERVLQCGNHVAAELRGYRPDLVADHLGKSGGQGGRVGADACLEHHQPARCRALERVVHPDHRAFGHGGMGRESRATP